MISTVAIKGCFIVFYACIFFCARDFLHMHPISNISISVNRVQTFERYRDRYCNHCDCISNYLKHLEMFFFLFSLFCTENRAGVS